MCGNGSFIKQAFENDRHWYGTRLSGEAKFKKGDVVYIRAFVTDIGECGTPAVRVEQIGAYAILVPKMSEVHKVVAKTTKTTIVLED